MISRQQFAQASGFLATYQDALKTVEDVAEKKQAYAHYVNTTSQLVHGMQHDQIQVQNAHV